MASLAAPGTAVALRSRTYSEFNLWKEQVPPVSEQEQPKPQPVRISMSDIKSDVSEEELTQLLAKVDKESTFRKLTGWDARVVYWIAVAFSCFHLYTGYWGPYPAQIQRSLHLSFAFALVFLLYPFRGKNALNKLRVA